MVLNALTYHYFMSPILYFHTSLATICDSCTLYPIIPQKCPTYGCMSLAIPSLLHCPDFPLNIKYSTNYMVGTV